jgi:hypothetical protein
MNATMTQPPPTSPQQQDDWKISKRGRACALCQRPFRSEEEHYSGIARVEARFERRDVCLPCWTAQKPELFSFWKTVMPKIEQKRFEDVTAMVEFFKKLVEAPTEDPVRLKIIYLMALLLARKRRVRLAGSKDGRLRVEKTWDGDAVDIAEPVIADAELADLREQMERIFSAELSAPGA